MRIFYWFLTILFIVGIIYSTDLHNFFLAHLPFYKFKDANLMTVVFSVAAGVFATKASDASVELQRLMKVPELKAMIEKAETSEERFKQLEHLIAQETQRQFARDMLINHRKQLINHWDSIITLERVLQEQPDSEFDPIVRNHIRSYILKSKYVDVVGRDMLKTIPFFGGILHALLGPLWDTYYSRNVEKIDKKIRDFNENSK